MTDIAAFPSQDESRAVSRRRRRREIVSYYLCTAPAVFVTLLVAVVPLAVLMIGSVRQRETGSFTFQYYLDTLSNGFFMRTLGTTIAMAGGVTVLAIALALPMAYLLARKTLLRNIIMPMITVPRMMPFVVIGYAMILLLAPMTGVFNRVLLDLGILSEPAFILFDWPGQAIAFGYTGIVVAIAILTGVLMSVDPQLEDAAVSMGASRLRSFFVVTVPLSIPGIVAASALIFGSIVTAYAIPVMLSGRVPYMVSVLIANNLLTMQQREIAFAQAVIISVLAIGITAGAQVVLNRYGRQGGA